MDKNMNFFDLCVVIGQAFGRGCKALWNGLLCMIRRTYRYWWVVVPVLVVSLVAALYISRPENLCYKMNAVAQLNGPTIQQFEQAYTPLRTGFLPDDAAITAFVQQRTVKRFDTYRVIDCLDDGFADYIDFKRKSKPFDTLNVQMQDRLCLQFRMKKRDMYALPQIEQALLDYLNSNAPMQKSYATYLTNLQDEVDFYKRRADEAIRIAEDVREIARKSLDHASDVNANNKLYNEDAKNLYEVIRTLQEYVPGKEEYEKLNSRLWSTGYVFRENQEKGTWDLYVCRDRRPKEEPSNGE